MRLEELKTTLAIQSSLLTATLHKLSGVGGEVETEINHFEMLPLKTMEDLNQLEAEMVDENQLRRLVGLPTCVDMLLNLLFHARPALAIRVDHQSMWRRSSDLPKIT